MLTDDYTLLDFAGCLLNTNGGSLLGLIKLSFLLFLSQYEKDYRDGSIVKYLYDSKPITRTEFTLLTFGPFNIEIYDILDEFEIVSGPNITLIISQDDGYCNKLPNPVSDRIKHILNKYKKYDAMTLRETALNMLGIETDDDLRKYYGYHVDDYIEEARLNLKSVDLKYSRL